MAKIEFCLCVYDPSKCVHQYNTFQTHTYRYYLGRRTADDDRQISRWAKCTGVKGRWRNNLISKCVRSGCAFDNHAVSPVVRQTLQHWGYRLTEADFKKYAKKVKLWVSSSGAWDATSCQGVSEFVILHCKQDQSMQSLLCSSLKSCCQVSAVVPIIVRENCDLYGWFFKGFFVFFQKGKVLRSNTKKHCGNHNKRYFMSIFFKSEIFPYLREF